MSTWTAAPRIVVMGVSGCGKSTVGSIVARVLGVPFVDADGLHPDANVATMAAGTPLTDDDRLPWLARVGAALAAPDGVVVACSALRLPYRSVLRAHAPDAVFVHLHGTREQLAARLAARLDHFMPPALLDTQLATLEPLRADEAGLVLDIGTAPDRIVADVAAWWHTRAVRTAGASLPVAEGAQADGSSSSTGSRGASRRSEVKAGTSASYSSVKTGSRDA